ncbi:Replication protein A 70 kDa DNA-binding subunit C, partial [Linum perenne]
ANDGAAPPNSLSSLGNDAKGVTLRLRLLNCWKAGNPTRPDSFFAYSTLWTDQMGSRVEGTASPVHADSIASQLQIQKVYDVAGFSLAYPRRSHRAASYPRYLQLTPATTFMEVLEPGAEFVQDSFEFVPFDQLMSRLPPFAYLSDVVGRLVSISEPDHLSTVGGFAKKQSIIISNDSGVDLPVTLWGSFCAFLVPGDLMLASLSGPVVLAFGGMLVTSFRGQLSIASSSATRISVAPKVEHPLAIAVLVVSLPFFVLRFEVLINGSSVSQFDVLRAKFPDLGSLEEHVRASFRTISQLHDLAHSSAPDENRYRCRATVQSIDGEDRWCYLACKSCTRAVAPVDGKFWCDRHELLDSGDTTYCYKIHLRVSDPTAEATFLLLGYSADAIMPLSAAELRHAFPCDGPNFPPQIEMFRNLELTFEVQQPGRPCPGTFVDFRVNKIFDLPSSFGLRKPRSSGKYISATVDSPRYSSSRVFGTPPSEIGHGSPPSLGIGNLALASPASCQPAADHCHSKETGSVLLPSSLYPPRAILPTPDKAPSCPRAYDSTPTTQSSLKRQTPDSPTSKLDLASYSDVEDALNSDDESVAQFEARLKRARANPKSSARRSLFESE